MGYTELMQHEIPAATRAGNYLEMIQSSAGRAAKLTQGLLTYSRKQVTRLEPFDLNRTVRHVRELLNDLVGENVRLSVSIAGGELNVLADRAQIEQVIMNLATNALDAMPGGGSLAISTGRFAADEFFLETHGLSANGGYVVLSMADTGEGMDKATKEKIFEPFFTTKQAGKGTGLGLSMVYGIVKKHGGAIEVESAPGKGTVFRVYLPAASGRPGADQEKPAVDAIGRPEEDSPAGVKKSATILLAEDDPGVCQLIRTILEKNGYRVLTARDGEEAVRLFRDSEGQGNKIDLLVFDMMMPGKNGHEAYKEIRSVSPRTKGVFISGHSVRELTGKLGASGVKLLKKPVLQRELLAEVRRALEAEV